MKRAIVIVVLVAAAAAALATAPLGENAENALTTIDQVPTKEQIDNAFARDSQDPLTQLNRIATTPTDPMDPDWADTVSIRLRAIHALAKYCTSTPCAANDVAHQSVAQVITMTGSASSGADVLILRAAVETLGLMKVASDVTTLQVLLAHPSRDIRAATARALRDLCNQQASFPLAARLSVEMTPQVKLAISEALRILDQCSPNP
jgi:hypothetical protein